MQSPLENPTWHALNGAQARFAAGAGAARRYAPGLPPIVAFADPRQPDFRGLAPYCAIGEHYYCAGWSGAAPSDWRIDVQSTMFRMVWTGAGPDPDDAFDPVALGPGQATAALELVELTRPGPYGSRSLELGDYLGIFDEGRLIAMAGERLHAAPYREISAVCTHPEHRGRGLARRLMHELIRRQLRRGEIPILHVMHENAGAHALYRRMGFADHAETIVRVVSPC
jgi:ribosomal protein S18 acetylase RimI-like enzyme